MQKYIRLLKKFGGYGQSRNIFVIGIMHQMTGIQHGQKMIFGPEENFSPGWKLKMVV